MKLRRLTEIFVVVVLLIVVLVFILPYFNPWTPLNRRTEEVDINTGRLRFSREILYLKIQEHVEESPLSNALPADFLATAKPDWQRVNTFSPGIRNSPHHRFHGAIAQIQSLEHIWNDVDIPKDKREKIALHVLALWRFEFELSLAGDYIDALYLSDQPEERDRIIAALPTLAMPKIEKDGNKLVKTVFYPNGYPMLRIEGIIDSYGRFIHHGNMERWYSNGKRKIYTQVENEREHGLRFEWGMQGNLTAIITFDHGRFLACKKNDLEDDPDYKRAKNLQGD